MGSDTLNRDTTLCMSLSARPSNIGTRFHNFLYDELGLDYVYKSFTTTDLPAAIAGVRALGIRGCGISMPFKQACVEHVDVLHPSARSIGAVNTVVNEDGVLHAHNTDYTAVATLIDDHGVDRASTVAVAGSGAMATTVVAALHDVGFRAVTVVSRNHASGRGLAGQYGCRWRPDLGDLRPRLLVNATPVGMVGADGDRMPFTGEAVAAADTVFDVVAIPPDTPLVRAATRLGKTVITGAEVIALQAAAQFELYTGVRPTPDQVHRASAFSRIEPPRH